MLTKRLANVLQSWAATGHTKADFARITGIHPTGVGRMFAGDQRPEPDTFSDIVAKISPSEPQLARDMVEAYLLDDVPDGPSPDGRPWSEIVRVLVESPMNGLAESQVAMDPFEVALANFNRIARTTTHGRNYVLAFARWMGAEKPQS